MLQSLLPKIKPHTRYVEAFAGGLALLLAKERSRLEIVNDINGDIVALYRCARNHLEALTAELRLVLFSRQELAGLLSDRGLTDIQRAARFLLRNKLSFGGGGTSYGVTRSGPTKLLSNLPAALDALHHRLQGVSIEHLPYQRLLKLYDGPDAFVFLDPPYLNSAPCGGSYEGARIQRARPVPPGQMDGHGR